MHATTSSECTDEHYINPYVVKDNNMSFNDKINQCAKIIGVSPEQVKKIFADEEQFSLITGNLSESDIADMLVASIKLPKSESAIVFGIKAKAAAKILVVGDVQQPVDNTQINVSIPAIINSIKPMANWSDREILCAYIADQSDELEAQLMVRSKGRRFVVTNPSDSDTIDVETTLTMLKRARKDDMPEYYRTGDGTVVYMYRINDLSRKSRTRHVCPVCGGILFDDHCAKCDISFAGLTKEQRQFVYVAMLSPYRTQSMDGKSLVAAIRNKFDGIHPMILHTFNVARESDDLPSLIKVEKPYIGNVAGDPFKVRG